MTENKKLLEAVTDCRDAQVALTAARRMVETGKHEQEEAEKELLRVMHATGKKEIIFDGKRYKQRFDAGRPAGMVAEKFEGVVFG